MTQPRDRRTEYVDIGNRPRKELLTTIVVDVCTSRRPIGQHAGECRVHSSRTRTPHHSEQIMQPLRQQQRIANGDEGSALIAVLMIVAVLTVMVTHLTASSEIAGRESHALATRTSLKYDAESAAERAFWLFLADRRQFRSRALSVLQPEDLLEDERWRADGSSRDIKGRNSTVQVTLLDANRGLDVSGPRPEAQLRAFLLRDTTDFEQVETVTRFVNVLQDYVDRSAMGRLHGKSQDDYAAEGYPDMPRNAPLEMREEVIWIEGIDKIMAMLGRNVTAADFMDMVRIIPPRGRSFPDNERPSFFSSSPLLIQRLAGLTDEELDSIWQAQREWRNGRGNLFTYLDPGLTNRLRQHFSFTESSVVTVVATASSEDTLIQRQMRLTRHVAQFAQPRATTRVVENWQKVFF